MYLMDIKLLLLKSLSWKKPIAGSRRIYCGKSCFLIKYAIQGTLLNITSIKRKRKHKTWTQRMKFYNKMYKLHCDIKNNKTNLVDAITQIFDDKETLTDEICKLKKDVHTETLKYEPKIKETATQTFHIEHHAKAVQTETIKVSAKNKKISKFHAPTMDTTLTKNKLVSTAQQTIISARLTRYTSHFFKKSTKSCQTDENTESKGVQCKRLTQIKAINTESNTRDSFSQTQHDTNTAEITQLFAIPKEDFELFVFMLNEIGENVMNQNQILNNNTDMMTEILKVNMVKKSKHLKDFCRSISTQTDKEQLSSEKKNNCSQTALNLKKPRKLSLFSGKNKQTKNKSLFL